jgi:hypothetical protein
MSTAQRVSRLRRVGTQHNFRLGGWYILLLLSLLPCLFAGMCYAQGLPSPEVPRVVPPPPVTVPQLVPPSSTRPGDATAGSLDTKTQSGGNCWEAYNRILQLQGMLVSRGPSKGEAAQDAYLEYFYDDYARKVAGIQLNAFMWQARASQVLLWIVVVVCLSGILFSGYQLWRATAPRSVSESGDKSNADPLGTNVELSWQSVRVRSSVIGLVVLVISVAYLYLFLKEVYAIKVASDLGAGSPPNVTSNPAPQNPPP